ncbi:FAD-dependent monooxygenase [Okibacterium endophyticum]
MIDGFDTDVVVVGLGPAGGTAAAALARYGVRVHAVSMYPWVANTPRAHITNQRTMEVLRDLDVEESALKLATPWDQMGDTVFAHSSLGGEEIARLHSWGTGPLHHGDYVEGSPCGMTDLPQPKLEPLLIDQAAKHGAVVSFNTEYLSHQQDDTGVTVTFRDTRTGSLFTQRARYLLAFDGARSLVAEQLDLPFEGVAARAGTVYLWFKADLQRLVEHRPSIIHFAFNSQTSFGEIGMGLFRAIEPWTEWILGFGFDLANGEPQLSDEDAIGLIRKLVGDDELDVELVRKYVWYVNQQHATNYQVGRVFCGGDAVHRHPPTSGLGSNTSIQDAFNLAWKVAFVVHGHAAPTLLDSYSPERVPVGEQIVARANQSRKDYAAVRGWIARNADNPVDVGFDLLQQPTAEGAALREALYEGLALKHSEFNAQGVELNQRYVSSAVLPDPSSPAEEWPRDRELHLQATTRPGAKLPHAWLVDGGGSRRSTLDVIGRGMFTLLTGLSGQAWARAAKQLGLPYLRVVVIGEADVKDPYGYWRRVREVDEAGAVLVRPDGYVAWRQTAATWDDTAAVSQLASALGELLGRELDAETAWPDVREGTAPPSH